MLALISWSVQDEWSFRGSFCFAQTMMWSKFSFQPKHLSGWTSSCHIRYWKTSDSDCSYYCTTNKSSGGCSWLFSLASSYTLLYLNLFQSVSECQSFSILEANYHDLCSFINCQQLKGCCKLMLLAHFCFIVSVVIEWTWHIDVNFIVVTHQVYQILSLMSLSSNFSWICPQFSYIHCSHFLATVYKQVLYDLHMKVKILTANDAKAYDMKVENSNMRFL